MEKELIRKHLDGCRFVYNLALECKQMSWTGYRVNLSCFELQKQLTDLKKECAWLKELNSQSLQASIKRMDNAYKLFFKRQKGFPKFKKKQNGGSFSVPF